MTAAERRRALPSEGQEQATLINYTKMQYKMFPEEYPGLEMLYHIPNGGKRSASEAARFKSEGVQAGVPDLFLPVPRGKYHGLYIEMKRLQGGKVSEAQSEMHVKLRRMGYVCEVAHGWQEAWEYIKRYYMMGEFAM